MCSSRSLAWIASLLVSASSVAAAAATAAPTAAAEASSCKKLPPGKRVVKLTLKPETELGDLVAWISSITCHQFIVPSTIPASSRKVTVVAPQLITPEEAYRLFLAALDSVGLTLEPSGRFQRIVESSKVRFAPMPVLGDGQEGPSGDAYVTRMVRVEHGDAGEIAQVLGRIKGEPGDIIVYPPTGTLIITDRAANVARMLEVVARLDTPPQGDRIWVVRLKHMAAADMVQRLADVFQIARTAGKSGSAAPVASSSVARTPSDDVRAELAAARLIPDERSNQVIVIAREHAYSRLLQMIEVLDVPPENGAGRMHIYYCEHASCDELAQTLGAVTGISVAGAAAGRTSGRSKSTSTPAAASSAGAQPGQSPAVQFQGDVRITFDRPTNSLVVMSSLADFQILRQFIERLDSPRKQVFVEALIMEVGISHERHVGAAYHGGLLEKLLLGSNSTLLGGFNASKTLIPSNATSSLVGLAAAVIGPTDSISAASLGVSSSTSLTYLPSFGVLIQALQSDNDVNIVSSPHLLITNNEEGEISVGQNVPMQGSTQLNTAGGTAIYGTMSVQRQDVALKLKLTPHVNEHNVIRLEVEQEISDIAAEDFHSLGPMTSKRTAKTIVETTDQQTVVIGGLMADKTTEAVTKVPILGDIPILGFLFRDKQKKIEKRNILLAFTPYVVSGRGDLRRILEQKVKEQREFADRFGKDANAEQALERTARLSRGRGMLEEINRAVREADVEDSAREEARRKLAAPPELARPVLDLGPERS